MAIYEMCNLLVFLLFTDCCSRWTVTTRYPLYYELRDATYYILLNGNEAVTTFSEVVAIQVDN